MAESIPVDAVYLDIDYMEGYKQFTWDLKKFPDPRGFVSEIHQLGAYVVAIIDPYIKAEPGYKPFELLLDCLLVTKDNELFLAKGWPGLSGLVDFLNPQCREKWAAAVQNFVSTYDIDGVWLDMNEPTVFNCDVYISKSRIYAAVGATPQPLAREELYCKAPAGAYHKIGIEKFHMRKSEGSTPILKQRLLSRGYRPRGRLHLYFRGLATSGFRNTPLYGLATCRALGRA